MDSKKLAEIGLLLMGSPKKDKPEDEGMDAEGDNSEQVARDAMQAFIDAVKGDDVEAALEHFKHLLRVCECEDGHEYSEE